MVKGYSKIVFAVVLFTACQTGKKPGGTVSGLSIEQGILAENNLAKDFTNIQLLNEIITSVNCVDSVIIKKRIVLAELYSPTDTSEILLIPFIANGDNLNSGAYSDVKNRFILINPEYIRNFTLQNTLGDTSSFRPVLELMLLHETGHFLLNQSGAFDEPGKSAKRFEDSQPEYLTAEKKLELSADSIAIAIVRNQLAGENYRCMDIAFSVELIIPGIQYTLAGKRMIDNFGNPAINFLHDPGPGHPNLELRITYMNYFLKPEENLREQIDDYIYNRTAGAVHRQESAPYIYQGQKKGTQAAN